MSLLLVPRDIMEKMAKGCGNHRVGRSVVGTDFLSHGCCNHGNTEAVAACIPHPHKKEMKEGN